MKTVKEVPASWGPEYDYTVYRISLTASCIRVTVQMVVATDVIMMSSLFNSYNGIAVDKHRRVQYSNGDG